MLAVAIVVYHGYQSQLVIAVKCISTARYHGSHRPHLPTVFWGIEGWHERIEFKGFKLEGSGNQRLTCDPLVFNDDIGDFRTSSRPSKTQANLATNGFTELRHVAHPKKYPERHFSTGRSDMFGNPKMTSLIWWFLILVVDQPLLWVMIPYN